MDIEDLVRPNIKALEPYRSARQDFTSGILLDANENSLGGLPARSGTALHRYPDPSQTALRARLAALNATGPERVFVGVGSDEVIDLIIRLFCEPREDEVLVLAPTYGVYAVAAAIHDVRVRSVLLDDEFQIDVDAVRAASSGRTKVVFCCSPNNPTSNLLRPDDIAELCRSLHSIVVVDEAYIEFARTTSLAAAVEDLPNLIVLRTLSKGWGLAGIRLGYAIAQPAIISYLLKIKLPYNISTLTAEHALLALEDIDGAARRIKLLIRERERLALALARVPGVEEVFPSDANFLLVRFTECRRTFDELIGRGIIVRDRSREPKLAGCLRITVGTPEENEILLDALRGGRR